MGTKGEVLKLKLQGKEFQIMDPEIRFGRMNFMAFVSQVGKDRPSRIEIEFDGSPKNGELLQELALEIGYGAELAPPLAIMTPD